MRHHVVEEMVKDVKMGDVAKAIAKINSETRLYCTECCIHFELRKDGKWAVGDTDLKVAEFVGPEGNQFVQCTCGTNIATVANDFVLPGQVVPML